MTAELPWRDALRRYDRLLALILQCSLNYPVLLQITAVGELVTLPLVVLVSFMAQPRLLFAMAKDGLMPSLFSQVLVLSPAR